MTERFRNTLVMAGLLLLTTGASTSFKSTWKDPNAGPLNFKGKKVLALVILEQEASRRGAEMALSYELNQRGVAGIPGYSVIPEAQMKDKDAIKSIVQAAGFAGAVVMKVGGKTQEITSSPATYWGGYYSSFSGYYGYGWGGSMMADPGYINTDNFFSVETLIYDIASDKLVWAGLSQTKNPKSVDQFVKDLAKKAAEQMKKQGLTR